MPPKVTNRRRFLNRSLKLALASLTLPYIVRSRAGTAQVVDYLGGGDLMISLTNAAWCRAFDMGEWTQLRFGLRLLAGSNGGISVSYTPRWEFGLQSGESTMPLDTSVTNLVGYRTIKTGWTVSGSAPNQYYSLGISTSQFFSKTGSTVTTEATPSSGAVLPVVTASNVYGAIFQLTKGTPYQASLMMATSSPPGGAMSRSTFLDAIVAAELGKNTGGTSITGYAVVSDTSLAVTESAGTFDHVFAAWDRPEWEMLITDIAIAKVS